MIKLQGRIEEAHFAAISMADSEEIEYGFHVKFDFGRAGNCVYNKRKNTIQVFGDRCEDNLGKEDAYDGDNSLTWLTMAEFLRAAKAKTLEELKQVFIIGLFNDKCELVSVQFGLDDDAREVLL